MRTLIGLFIFLIFFPLAVAALTMAAISSWVLDRGFYEDILTNEALYDALLSEEIPNYFDREILTEIDSVPASALSAGLRVVVTPEYLSQQARGIVDEVFNFIEGQDYTLDLAIDFTPVKANLAGPGAENFAQAFVDMLPACSPGQEPFAAGGTLIRCLDESITSGEAIELITDGLPTWIDRIPDRLEFGEPFDLRANTDQVAVDILGMTARGGLMAAVAVLFLMAGGLWVLMAFAASGQMRGRLLWLGFTLLIPAGIVFLMGLTIEGMMLTDWARAGLQDARFYGVEYSMAFRQAMLAVFGSAFSRVATGFLAIGGITGGLAFGLTAWGWVYPGSSEKRKN